MSHRVAGGVYTPVLFWSRLGPPRALPRRSTCLASRRRVTKCWVWAQEAGPSGAIFTYWDYVLTRVTWNRCTRFRENVFDSQVHWGEQWGLKTLILPRISECDLIWKKDHEMRWALNPKTRVLRRRGDDTHRFEEKAVWRWAWRAECSGYKPRTGKDYRQQREARTEGHRDSPSEPSGRTTSDSTLISDFGLPGLWEDTFLLF